MCHSWWFSSVEIKEDIETAAGTFTWLGGLYYGLIGLFLRKSTDCAILCWSVFFFFLLFLCVCQLCGLHYFFLDFLQGGRGYYSCIGHFIYETNNDCDIPCCFVYVFFCVVCVNYMTSTVPFEHCLCLMAQIKPNLSIYLSISLFLYRLIYTQMNRSIHELPCIYIYMYIYIHRICIHILHDSETNLRMFLYILVGTDTRGIAAFRV